LRGSKVKTQAHATKCGEQTKGVIEAPWALFAGRT